MKINNQISVKVIISDLSNNPHCDHGPAILFEKIESNTQIRYFACSACRDRNICGFYLDEKEKKINTARERTSEQKSFFTFYFDHHKKFKPFLNANDETLRFCNTCSKLFLLSEKNSDHNDCENILKLTRKEIDYPSLILPPLCNAKYEAQYLFTENSCKVIIKLIKNLLTEKVLCVGTPRIHEALRKDNSIKSLLLDIDQRFALFFPPSEVITYNLFNHYFFGGSKSKCTYTEFLKGCKKLTLVCDPPFGGRMELISNTFKIIEQEWQTINDLPPTEKLPILFIFPYFLEKSVVASIPDLTMLDYKVDYDNHPLYSKGPKGMKQGSAVRIYVNLPPSKFSLPPEEGYWNCEICERWRSQNNVHCFKCNSCTSKDGRTYKHCNSCDVCVKPSWVHCKSCTKCFPADHSCLKAIKAKKDFSCHYCGSGDHKRRDCTNRKNPPKKVKKNLKKKKTQIPQSKTEERAMHKAVLEQMFKSD